MKFITFAMFDAAKAVEIAQVADKVANTPGQKTMAQYVFQGIAFPGVPPGKMVSIIVGEAESNEAIAAVHYPLELAGATIWAVPVLELPVAGATVEEKKYRK